jgi:membrane protein DedA with SNARE-associated domain
LVASLLTLGPAALFVLMAIAFAESAILAGFLVPGDTLVFSTGALLATGALHLPLWLVMFAVALAAMLGDQVAYAIGRRCGPRLLDRPKSRLFSPRHSEHARELFERHGPKAVFLARFVPLARTLTPVVAGAARMPRRRFIRFNVAGAVAWSVLTLGGGYLFGGIPWFAGHLEPTALAVAVFSVLPIGVAVIRDRRRGSAARSRIRVLQTAPPA